MIYVLIQAEFFNKNPSDKQHTFSYVSEKGSFSFKRKDYCDC